MISLRKHSRPKMLVEQHLAVVHLAVVDVEVQAAVRGEQAVGLDQARLEECQVIVEQVGVASGADLDRPVAPAGEPGAVARSGSRRARSGSGCGAWTLPVLKGGSM